MEDKTIWWIVGIGVLILIIGGGWLYNKSQNLGPGTIEPPLIGGCAGVALEYQQECCARWAAENQIVTPACVGGWVVGDGGCGWVCG